MNNAIFYFFYSLAHQSAFFDNIVIFTAVYFPYIVILLAGLFLFLYRKNWREFFLVFFSGFLAYFLAVILKILFHTSRPFEALSNVYSLFPETGLSFPSSHATFFSALAVSLFFYHKKAGYVFMFFALLIGLSRIVAGVHFPIDIFGGFILGIGVAYFLKNI